jgi:hypothetical protein
LTDGTALAAGAARRPAPTSSIHANHARLMRG